MAQMDLTPLDDVLDKYFGKVGTPKRDAFEKGKPYALLSFDNSRVSVPKIII